MIRTWTWWICSSTRSRSESGADSGPSFVAIDRAQAGTGDRVIVLTEGNGVRQILKQGDQTPIRSIIVGIVDAVEVGGAS